MNTIHRASYEWPEIRLLLRDYLQRRRRRVLLMAATNGLIALIFPAVRFAMQSKEGVGWSAFFVLFLLSNDLPKPGRQAEHPDPKAIRTLPLTEESAAMALWLQYVGIPLILLIASGILALLAGVVVFGATLSTLGRCAAYVSVMAMSQFLLVGLPNSASWRSMRTAGAGKGPWVPAAYLAGSLAAVAVIFAAVLSVNRETSTVRLAGVAASTALLLLWSSFLFRRQWLMDTRMMKGIVFAQPSAPKQAAFARRRWQDRCFPLLAAASTGLVCAVLTAVLAAVVGLSWQGTPDKDSVEIFLLVPVLICMTGNMLIIMLWLPAARACRALPISRERLAFCAMAVQLLSVVPSLLVLGAEAWWFWTRQNVGISMHTLLSMGLSVEAILLFVYPYAVRSGEGQNKESMILSLLLVGFAGMMVKLAEPSFIMPLLPVAGLALLAAALVFCYRRLCKFIANDNEVYQKHPSPLF